MTSIAIIGGTGYVGSHIAAEADRRGLAVTTLGRSERPVGPGRHVVGSYADQVLVEQLAAEHDVLVLAVHATGEPALLEAIPGIAKAAIAGGARLGVVGGAGSLRVGEG